MFSETIGDFSSHVGTYETNCPDVLNRGIAGELRQCAILMKTFDEHGTEVERKCSELDERLDALAEQRNKCLTKLARIRKLHIPSQRDANVARAPSYAGSIDGDADGGSDNIHVSYRPLSVARAKIYQGGLETIMSDKDKEMERAVEAAFSSFRSISSELETANHSVEKAAALRKTIRELAVARGRLDESQAVTETEVERLERRHNAVHDMAISSNAIHNDAKALIESALGASENELSKAIDLLSRIREAMKGFDKFWHGSSGVTRRYLSRIESLLSACREQSSRCSAIRQSNSEDVADASRTKSRWEKTDSAAAAASRKAKDDRRQRQQLLGEVEKVAKKAASQLSMLSGTSAETFLQTISDPAGFRATVLNESADEERIIGTVMHGHRAKLERLANDSVGDQRELTGLNVDNINKTLVFPKHVVIGDMVTRALDGKELSVPRALDFPFESPLSFEDVGDIAPFVVRLLYALPINKLQVWAIDHHDSGDNIGVLNSLCAANGLLRIVTSADDISPMLREIDDQMGEMARSVFTYQENNWSAYNKKHPTAALPLRLVLLYSLSSFSTTQLDLLEKLLINGPRFGIICLLPDGIFDELDDRQRDRFEEVSLDLIEANGTRVSNFSKLALTIKSDGAIPATKIGEIAAHYAHEFGELIKQPKREIKFSSLFEKVESKDEALKWDGEFWSGSSAKGLSATIGWDASGYPVSFEFGVGKGVSNYHALIGGTTGSGKSVFLHTLIQSLAGKYSPDELQFYLLDYKKGDEFKKYADAKGVAWLPHIKMISRHKDPRFALELFSFLDKEFKRRSELFGEYGDIVAYREHGGKIPRIVIIIDECQVLFEEYCGLNLSDEIAKRLSTVFKQGRSYGIHLVLATQSLASLHFTGMAGILGQIGLRIALKGTASDGILADGNRAAETVIAKSQCVVNPAFGRKDSDGIVNNYIAAFPLSDPVQDKDDGCRKFRMVVESISRQNGVISNCRVFNGAALPLPPEPSVVKESLKPVKWNTHFTVLLGAKTDFVSTPFAIPFTHDQREHLLITGEDGNLSSDFEIKISGEDVWAGIRRGISRSLEAVESCDVLYYNPGERDVPSNVSKAFHGLGGMTTEEELLKAIQELVSSTASKKIFFVENFQDAQMLHPGDAPRPSFSSKPAEPHYDSPHSLFASVFNGTGSPSFHVIIMTKNFGFMNKEVLARSGAEANILKSCGKRIAYNISDDDMTAMIPHQKPQDRRGPMRIWFEDMRTGAVSDFMPYEYKS